MLVAFVLSVFVWSLFMGRLIAFGPNVLIVSWCPVVHSLTWYRMTHIYIVMPYWFLVIVPFLFMVSQIPMLIDKNIQAWVISVVSLISWQAFVPIFVAHVHSEYIIAFWSLINLFMAVAGLLISFSAIVPLFIFLWFMWMQIQVMYVGIVRENPGGIRQTRVV